MLNSEEVYVYVRTADYSIRLRNPGQPADSAICCIDTLNDTQLTSRCPTALRASGERQERSSLRDSVHVRQRRPALTQQRRSVHL